MKVFSKIDDQIFQQLEKLKTQENYIKVENAFSELDDEMQRYVRYGIAAILFILPILFITIFSMNNSSAKAELAEKISIIETANSIIARDTSIKRAERQYLGPGPISTQGAFEQRLIQSINSSGSETENIKILSFEKSELSGNIVQFTSEIEFKEQTNKQLFTLIATLKTRLKLKLDSLNIKRDGSAELLNGIMTVAYYWKSTVNEDEEEEEDE
jgi:hypothetical protein